MSTNDFSEWTEEGWTKEDFARWLRENYPAPDLLKDASWTAELRIADLPPKTGFIAFTIKEVGYGACMTSLAGQLAQAARNGALSPSHLQKENLALEIYIYPGKRRRIK